jgi:hypothetical protein
MGGDKKKADLIALLSIHLICVHECPRYNLPGIPLLSLMIEIHSIVSLLLR